MQSVALPLLVLALCVGLAPASSTVAPWKSQVAVTNLASGGQPLFFTYSGTTFSLKEGQGADEISAPPPPAQSFDFSGGYPNGLFTIKTGSKYIQLVGTSLVVSSTVAAAPNAQWSRSTYGHFISAANPQYAIDVATVTKNALIVAAKYNLNKTSQQWVVLPSQDSGFTGVIKLWDTANPNLCLQGPFSPIPFNATLPGTAGLTLIFPMPTLSPCDPSNPYQAITAISPDAATLAAMQNWQQPLENVGNGFSTGWFQLKFNNTGVCITFTQPFTGTKANVGRAGLLILLIDCDGTTDPATSGHFQYFGYDSRGQIQSSLVPPSTQNNANIIVNCLSNDGRYSKTNVNDWYYNSTLQGSDCSLFKFSNRWIFLDPSW